MKKYVIRDLQFDCRYYADGQVFKSKKEIEEELVGYHSIDFTGADDNDNELDIYDYIKYYKIKNVLKWILEYGQWEIEEAGKQYWFLNKGE